MNHPYFPDGSLLIGKGTLYNVFLVLYGTYREHIINNGVDAGNCSIGLNQLSKFSTVEKSTALKCFNALVEMGLVYGRKTEGGDFSFRINVDLYESAILYLDTQISSTKQEQLFLKAFQNNDKRALSEMGFQVQKGQLRNFSQRPAARSTMPQGGGKFTHLVENSPTFDEEGGGKFTHLVENSPNQTEVGENSTTFEGLHLSDAEKVVEFYTTSMVKEFQKWAKIPPLLILQRLGRDTLSDCSQILLELEDMTHELIHAKVVEFSQQVGENSPSSGGIFAKTPSQHAEVQEIASPNKYNKYIKKINQNEVLEKEKEKKEKDFELDEDFEPCFNFHEPLPTIELKGVGPVEELPVRDQENYPFFFPQEVDEFINNLELAKTSPLKLFLYNLWGYASDMTYEGYDRDFDEDEEDNLSEEEFFDPDGSIITKTEYRQLLLESYEQTAADIEKGCIELDEETVSLSIKEIFPRRLLFKIFDWENVALNCREMSVVISKSRIRNIEATSIQAVHQPKTREEKRQAAREGRVLMKRLYKAKHDETLYSQLTPIEKIAADVIAQYYIPNPDKEDRAPFAHKNGLIMVKEGWRALKAQIKRAGLKESDFLSSLLNNKGPNDGEQLILQEPLFFCEGLKAVNEAYQQISILDSIKIDE